MKYRRLSRITDSRNNRRGRSLPSRNQRHLTRRVRDTASLTTEEQIQLDNMMSDVLSSPEVGYGYITLRGQVIACEAEQDDFYNITVVANPDIEYEEEDEGDGYGGFIQYDMFSGTEIYSDSEWDDDDSLIEEVEAAILQFLNRVSDARRVPARNLRTRRVTDSARFISPKDWDIMFDLLTKDNDGNSLAKTIKNKDKAVALFVAGCHLAGEYPTIGNTYSVYYVNTFSPLGYKALTLGATVEEIEQVFNLAQIPEDIEQKLDKYFRGDTQMMDDRFVGHISKAVTDLGYDISYEIWRDDAMTNEGIETMRLDPRKWTIGYAGTVTSKEGKTMKFAFDVITDEIAGYKPSYYVQHNNFTTFLHPRAAHNKTSFLKGFLQEVKHQLG